MQSGALHRTLWLPMYFSLLTLVGTGCGGGGDNGDGETSSPCLTLRVAGGESCESPPRSVAIVATDGGYCTGTFVTQTHVLTAAHCFEQRGERVLVGTRGYAEDAIRVAIHPRYDGSVNSPFDIAVVTLGVPANISPVPVKVSQKVNAGDSVVAYGYGVDQSGLDVVQRVREGGLPLKATPLDVVAVDPGTVASQSDGTGDTCQGDSGGALLLTGDNGEPGIVALVRAGPPGCVPDSGLPSANSNVQGGAALDFILQQAPGARTN